jgi:hypothetical protein
MAFTTRSTGMMSMTPSGRPGNSGIEPRPYARMIGSAILNPSIHPGYGFSSELSTIEGRTIERGSPNSVDSCSATRSPRALVNV